MFIFLNSVVFIASFLLFQIELIVANVILPGFGGSFQVWSSCLVFFQGFLLLGYFYAYQFHMHLNIRRHFVIHILIVLLPLFFFPIRLDLLQNPHYQIPMIIDIIIMLTQTIGLAFFVLTSVSIFIQNFLTASNLRLHDNPYVLYATSNAGSFTALLTYPFLFNSLFTFKEQIHFWQVGYGLLALLFLVLYFNKNRFLRSVKSETVIIGERPSWKDRITWLLLSCAASTMLLAVTNIITFDIASIPLLWIIPLSIYLWSFILVFKKKCWYPLWLKDRFPLASIVGLFLFLLMEQSYKLPVLFLLGLHSLILFIFCITCHGEIIHHKPNHPNQLSEFYILIALGGFLGSILVSWIIPLVSTSIIEYPVAFLIALIGFSIRLKRSKFSGKIIFRYALFVILLLLWPLALNVLGSSTGSLIAILSGILMAINLKTISRDLKQFAVAFILFLITVQFFDVVRFKQSIVHKHRNYYGIYRIYDIGNKRYLQHGTTLHGSQYLDPIRQKEALAYYHVTAPAGNLLESWSSELERIGIIGLGTGSLAAYATSQQAIDMFELDPYNETIANRYFTYLEQCEGKLQLIFGDARLSLQNIPNATYSILIVDAFNSDAIPIHLLTVEAISEYIRCLDSNGLILFHISNKYLDLTPVLKANTGALKLHALKKTNVNSLHPDAEACEWIAITSDSAISNRLVQELKWNELVHIPIRNIRPWTDQYNNILSVIR